MSDDTNESNIYTSWDCAGMTLLLASAPLVIIYVFVKPETYWLMFGGGIVAALALFVFVLSQVTKWLLIGRVLDTLGTVLAFIYVAVAIYLWSLPQDAFKSLPSEEEKAALLDS